MLDFVDIQDLSKDELNTTQEMDVNHMKVKSKKAPHFFIENMEKGVD